MGSLLLVGWDAAGGLMAMRGRTIDVGGPENLTMSEFVEVFRTETTSTGRVGHVPLPAMRVMAIVMRLLNPSMARQIQAGAVMDTRPQAFDALETRARYPSIPITRLAEVVSRDFANSRGPVPATNPIAGAQTEFLGLIAMLAPSA